MRTIIINNPGPQGAVGPQGNVGPTGSSQPFSNVSGSIWATTSSLEVTGSFTNLLSPTNLKIQSNLSSSFFVGATYVNGVGWPSLVFSGSQVAFRSDINGTFVNGLNNGRIHIPAFGLSFPYQGTTQTITTGSDFVFIGTQYTDATAIGGSPQLNAQQSAVLSGSYGYNEYLNQIAKNYNTGESSLNIQKRNNAGETIALNLNSSNDGFSIFSTLSQPTSSFLKLVSGSSNNLVDFRYDANYFKQKTFIGDIYPALHNAVLQVKGSGATNATTALLVENTNGSASLTVRDDGSSIFTNNVTVTGSTTSTGGFTGSLFGTASWANNALTASFISTASTNAFVQGGNSFGAQALLGTNDDQSLAFETSGSVRMFISSSGQVGIGKTPSQSLDVAGKIGLNDGGNSVYVGTDVGTIDDATNNQNVGIGYIVLSSASNAPYNVGIGAEVLTKLTTGTFNVGIGYRVLANNTADVNIGIGAYALNQNTTGNFNNAVGSNTLLSCSVGINNTAFGSSALRNATSGSNNVALGGSSLLNIVTGSGNVAVGSSAGRYFGTGTSSNTDASSSIFIGRNTRANASGESNQIVIGDSAIGLGSNTVVLGNDTITRTALKGNISIGTTGSISSRLHIQGSGATSGTTALRVENTNASASLVVLDDGAVGIGTATPTTTLQIAGTATLRAILPELDNTYNIGSATFRYNNIYARAILSGASTLDLYSTISSFFDSVGNRRMTIVGSSGNVIIGSSATDAGFRLDVNGTARFSDTLSFTNFSSLSPQGTTTADRRLLIRGGEGGAVGSTSLITLTTNGNITSTSGNPVLVNISRDFSPTSGTATYALASITATINQTGGANGITRGLYINPTLTAAADFRAIDSTNGRVVIADTATVTGSNATSLLDLSQTWNTSGQPIAIKLNITDTTSAALSDLISLQVGGSPRFRVLKSGFFVHNTGGEIGGNLVVGGSTIDASSQLEVRSATRGFLPPRMTNAQRVAISTPAVGLMVYCTDATEGLYIYKSTGWTFIV